MSHKLNPCTWPFLGSYAGNATDTYEKVGALYVPAGQIPTAGFTALFDVLLATTDAANSAYVRIYDLDALAQVAGSELSTALTVPTYLTAAVTIKPATRYLLQVKLTTADPLQLASCSFARIYM